MNSEILEKVSEVTAKAQEDGDFMWKGLPLSQVHRNSSNYAAR